MYHSGLKIFIEVADCGSFTKASEKLFISPTAIMKQMNLLEHSIGVPLLDRTHHGISLTESGKSIYKDAKYIIEYSDEAIKRAKTIHNNKKSVIRIGTSLLNPCKTILDLWSKINDMYPQFKIQIVPFEDDHASILNTIKNIGKNFDFIVGVCDSLSWLQHCNFYKLGDYKFTISCGKKHPLAKKKSLRFKDLSNETIMTVKEGDSLVNNVIRDNITKNYPTIKIEDAPFFYDIDVFNKCEENDVLLLGPECWKDVHPALVAIPLKEDYIIPFGIIYSKTPSKDALDFLNVLKAIKK